MWIDDVAGMPYNDYYCFKNRSKSALLTVNRTDMSEEGVSNARPAQKKRTFNHKLVTKCSKPTLSDPWLLEYASPFYSGWSSCLKEGTGGRLWQPFPTRDALGVNNRLPREFRATRIPQIYVSTERVQSHIMLTEIGLIHWDMFERDYNGPHKSPK